MKTSVGKFREIKDPSVSAHTVPSACPGSCAPLPSSSLYSACLNTTRSPAQVHQGLPTTTHLLFLVPVLSHMREKAAFSSMYSRKEISPPPLAFPLLEMGVPRQQCFLCAEPHPTPDARVQLLLLTRVCLSRI